MSRPPRQKDVLTVWEEYCRKSIDHFFKTFFPSILPSGHTKIFYPCVLTDKKTFSPTRRNIVRKSIDHFSKTFSPSILDPKYFTHVYHRTDHRSKKVMDPLGGILFGRVSIIFSKLFSPDPISRSLYYLVVIQKYIFHVYPQTCQRPICVLTDKKLFN